MRGTNARLREEVKHLAQLEKDWCGAHGTENEIDGREGVEGQQHPGDVSARVLEALLDLIPSPAFYLDNEGKYRYCNRAHAREILGLSGEMAVGKLISELVPEASRELRLLHETDHQTLVADGGVHQNKVVVTCADGVRRDFMVTESVFWGEDGDAEGIIVLLLDITERRQMEEDFRRAEEAMRQQLALQQSVAASMPYSCYVSDARSDKVLYYNRQFVEIWGAEDIQDELRRGEIRHAEVLARLMACAADGKEFERHWRGLDEQDSRSPLEGDLLLKNGRIVHHLAVQVLDDNGHFLGRLSVFEDVTKQKQSAQRLSASLNQKEVLLREVYHRVKNNLQVISSLLNLQSFSVSDPGTLGLLRETQDRVRSMALVHEKLYRADDLCKIDFADYARQLVAMLARSYQTEGRGVNLRFTLQAISLNLDTSIPCGLILNELVSNALKYAFRGRPTGEPAELQVKLEIAGPGTYVLVVADNGIGLPAEIDVSHTDSLGLQVVAMLTEQLSGTIEVERSRGTSFKLTFHEIRDGRPSRAAGSVESGGNPMDHKAEST